MHSHTGVMSGHGQNLSGLDQPLLLFLFFYLTVSVPMSSAYAGATQPLSVLYCYAKPALQTYRIGIPWQLVKNTDSQVPVFLLQTLKGGTLMHVLVLFPVVVIKYPYRNSLRKEGFQVTVHHCGEVEAAEA